MGAEVNTTQDTGSAPGQDAGSADQGLNQGQKDSVKYETFDKLVGQLKKTKELNENLSQRLDAFETEKRQLEETKLAEQGEYKKLLEMRTAEIKELQNSVVTERSEKEVANRTLNDAQKLQAVYEELPGKIKHQRYMQFIDLDKVAINPETGDVDRESAKLTANLFAEEHTALIDTTHVGRLPGNPASTNQPISKRFRELPLKDMRANMAQAVQEAKKELGL